MAFIFQAIIVGFAKHHKYLFAYLAGHFSVKIRYRYLVFNLLQKSA